MKVGPYRNQSNDAYHSGPGLSHSGVKRLLRSPFHFFAIAHEPDMPPLQPTPQQFAGTLCHCATLEPDAFDVRYRVGPEVNKNSSEWKAFKARNPNVDVISVKQRETAMAQAAALRAHPIISELLAKGEPELSIYWRDVATDVLCKARPDWVHPCGKPGAESVILLDVKTTSDASPEGFAKAVATYGYHTQAEWYCTGYEQTFPGVRCEGMVFAVVENEFPYACAAYMVDEDALLFARERNRHALNLYVECDRRAQWPGYPADLQVISLPRWALQ